LTQRKTATVFFLKLKRMHDLTVSYWWIFVAQ